ncbi:MAG: plasmid pRiA4b ORF-3 family protein [Bacteroidia bacterium]|nr:plasmid pRiA4b ORF-3 family protein [Bacteroidia bacterium]
MILQLKITLQGTEDPVVWRRVQLDSESNFFELHAIIQGIFGWENSHLWEFFPNTRGPVSVRIGFVPDEDDMDMMDVDDEMEDSDLTPVGKYLKKKGDTFRYLYDFGDSWEHLITVEKVTEGELELPVCLEGVGASPLEDIGGVPGYYYMLEVIADPTHPEHSDFREWMGLDEGESWDKDFFSVEEANEVIKMMYSEEDDLEEE